TERRFLPPAHAPSRAPPRVCAPHGIRAARARPATPARSPRPSPGRGRTSSAGGLRTQPPWEGSPSLEVSQHLAHAHPVPADGTPALEIEDGRDHAHAPLARHVQRSPAALAVGHAHHGDHALALELVPHGDYFWAASFLAVSFSSRIT